MKSGVILSSYTVFKEKEILDVTPHRGFFKYFNTDNFTHYLMFTKVIIPMNDKVFYILGTSITKIVDIQKSGYVFKKKGRRFNSEYISKAFKGALREAAKESTLDSKIHFHDLRHSIASNLAQKGVSLYVIKELLGQKDIKATMIYAHLSTENFRQAVELLN